MSHKNAVTVLEQGLAVCVAVQLHDAPMRARMAEDAIRGALGFLADVGEGPAAPAEPFEPYNVPDQMNPTRRLYGGEDFTVYLRKDADFRGLTSGFCTTDKTWAESGEHGFEGQSARDFFEDVLIDVLREDLVRPAGSLYLHLVDGSMIDATELAQPGVVIGVLGVDFHLPSAANGTNAVADDEIDEDPVADEALEAMRVLALEETEKAGFQRGYAAGQHDALEALAGPGPTGEDSNNAGEQGPEKA